MEQNLAWNDEEIEFLQNNYPHRKMELLIRKLREINLKNDRNVLRSACAISTKASVLKLTKTEYYKKSQKREQFFEKTFKRKKIKPEKFQDKILNLPESVIKK